MVLQSTRVSIEENEHPNQIQEIGKSKKVDDQYKMSSIFMEAQKSFSLHRKSVNMLRKMFISMKKDEFQKTFFHNLKQTLIIYKGNLNVERSVQLIARFLHYQNFEDHRIELEAFTMEVLEYLLQFTTAKEKAVRYRVCQLISLIFNTLDEDATISDSLWDEISSAMIGRCHDKLPFVRIQSINALKRLQQPEEDNDSVTQEYLRLLVTDASKDVRKAVLNCIAISSKTYPDILTRIRDSNHEVRKAFFELMGESVDPRHVSITDRVYILEQGLKDRNSQVRAACKKMLISHWLPSYDNSLVSFLQALDVEQFDGLGTLVIKSLLEASETNHDINVPDILNHAFASGHLVPENVLLWRVQCQVYKKQGKDLDKLLPNILPFVEILKAFLEDEKANVSEDASIFVLKELLTIGRFLDFQDEVGKRHLIIVLRGMLNDFTLSSLLVQPVMNLCISLYRKEAEFLYFISEVISDLCDMEENNNDEDEETVVEKNKEKEKAIARLEEIEDLFNQMDLEEDDHEQEEVKALEEEAEKLREILEDPVYQRKLRSLEVIEFLLMSTKQDMKNATICGLDLRIIPAIDHEIPAIREKAVRDLVLYCLLCENKATEHFWIFSQILEENDEDNEVQMTAIKGSFDILSVFQLTNVKNDQMMKTMSSLRNLLDCNQQEMKRVAVEGFSKLLLTDRLKDSSILQELIIQYFSNERSSHEEIIQILSVFFPAYAMISRQHSYQIESISMSVLRSLIWNNQQEDSSIIINCVQYLLHLMTLYQKESNALKDVENVEEAHHNRIAVKICLDLLVIPVKEIQKLMIRFLSSIELYPKDVFNLQILNDLMIQMNKKITNKVFQKSIQQFHIQIQELLKAFSPDEFIIDEKIQDWIAFHLNEHEQIILQKLQKNKTKKKSTTTQSRAQKNSSKLKKMVLKEEESSEELNDNSFMEEEEDDDDNDDFVSNQMERRVTSTRKCKLNTSFNNQYTSKEMKQLHNTLEEIESESTSSSEEEFSFSEDD